MRRLVPVVASCCIAGLALLMVSMAPAPCDEQKKITQVVNAEAGCPIEAAAIQLVTALKTMDADEPGREHLITALKSLSKLGPQAETRIAALCSDAGLCSKTAAVAQVAQVNAVQSACCAAAKAKAVAKVNASPQCSKSRKAQAVAQVNASPQCSKAKAAAARAAKAAKTSDVRFVAFGCEKTDRIARVAAKYYLDMVIELKKMTGAEGCPVDMANKVLASIVEERSSDRVATSDDAPVVTPVSLGAVSDKPACRASKKN